MKVNDTSRFTPTPTVAPQVCSAPFATGSRPPETALRSPACCTLPPLNIGRGPGLRLSVSRVVLLVLFEFEQLQIAGVIHALFSALDVVGGVIVGVAGLPRSILKADFGVAMLALEKPSKSPLPAHREAWLQLHQEVSAALAAPADWQMWLADLRNTVAYRAKIPTLHLVLPNGRAAISGGDLVRFVNIETRLPRQPARAFLQSMVSNPHEAYLDEPAMVTLTGVLDATVKFVEVVGDALNKLWARRSAGDLQLAQPAEQWPQLEPAPGLSFPGFAPGTALTGDLQWATSPDAFSALDGAGLGKRR